MMYAIARYYNTSERMTRLFAKITNQMVTCCKSYVHELGANLWGMDKSELMRRLRECAALYEAYRKTYENAREKMAQAKGKQFDFDVEKIFGKFDVFARRCKKLIDMFGSIIQLSLIHI